MAFSSMGFYSHEVLDRLKDLGIDVFETSKFVESDVARGSCA
jgi:hypothetical protein